MSDANRQPGLAASVDLELLKGTLARRPRLSIRLDGYRESAVLVPIVRAPGEPDRLIFTVRHSGLNHHAGQISFPGGKRDPDDADAVATALREAHEELGIAPAAVDVLGLLDDVPTGSSFMVTPVVAQLAGPVELRPAVSEVAEVFTCALPELRAAYHFAGTRTWRGVEYAMHEYLWQAHRIWGATARMVHQLLELAALAA